MSDNDTRTYGYIAAGLSILALATVLVSCDLSGNPPRSRSPDMPQGTGLIQHERGFSRFCADNPGVSTCPQR